SLLARLDAALSAAEVSAPDWLLPVPLSVARLRERGYNQAHELAQALARRDVPAARKAVGMIVGRDTAALDEAGVSRAAIESLA
ncbi:cobalamin biosynthesis protein, partial [Acinetobacter baumannii]